MRKLFMFLVVVAITAFGVACSSSDDSAEPVAEIPLVVTASKTTVEVGEKVIITVNQGTTDVTSEVTILVNGDKITGNELTSDVVGEFNVSAIKEGVKNPAAVVVVSFTAKAELKKLVLTAEPLSIPLDTETVFKVTLEGVDVTSTSVIKVEGVIAVGGKFVGSSMGDFKAVASRKGALDSDEITIVVGPPILPLPKANFVAVGGIFSTLKEAALFYFVDVNGKVIKETIEGKTYVAFSVRVFNKEINDRVIHVNFYDNSAILLLYVEQNPGSTELNTPFKATADQILIEGSNGEITIMDTNEAGENIVVKKILYTADEQAVYEDLYFKAPAFDDFDIKKGVFGFKVKGNTTEGDELLTDFLGPITAFYKTTIGGTVAKSTSKLTRAEKYNVRGNAVKVSSIK